MNRLTLVCGAFGSGKTEFAISYALALKKNTYEKVGLVDLDIVNPYFRTRDVAIELSEMGLEVISTGPGLEHSDLPALSPRIYSFLQDKSYQVVFDVGGDPVGARALGRFYQYFSNEAYNFWVVINPFRPDTKNLNEAKNMIAGLQNASRLQATGIISNINLGYQSTVDLWKDGLILINQIETELKIPIIYHVVEKNFLEANQSFFKDYPVFPITLKMLPPWDQI